MSEDHDRCFSTLVLGAFSTGVFNTNALPRINIGARLDGSAPGNVANQVRTSPPGDLAGNCLAIQATVYSPSGSTSSSPLVSYSTTSYFPVRVPVFRKPSTVSDLELRGAIASLSSFGDAASGTSASESSFIVTTRASPSRPVPCYP